MKRMYALPINLLLWCSGIITIMFGTIWQLSIIVAIGNLCCGIGIGLWLGVALFDEEAEP